MSGEGGLQREDSPRVIFVLSEAITSPGRYVEGRYFRLIAGLISARAPRVIKRIYCFANIESSANEHQKFAEALGMSYGPIAPPHVSDFRIVRVYSSLDLLIRL